MSRLLGMEVNLPLPSALQRYLIVSLLIFLVSNFIHFKLCFVLYIVSLYKK